jgi:superfamily II DNA helicase RecQ
MRTGGGKSLFFMLPAASTRTGVTIVIIPLNSLREDLKDRCDKVGISCAEWDGQRPPHWASIVLATPEAAVSTTFGRFIGEKRAIKQLDRIVLDECHVVLDLDNKWRPGILKLVEMTEKQTQFWCI